MLLNRNDFEMDLVTKRSSERRGLLVPTSSQKKRKYIFTYLQPVLYYVASKFPKSFPVSIVG